MPNKLFILAILAALLTAVTTAHAAGPLPMATPFAAAEEIEFEAEEEGEDETAEEECEEAEEELEEGEITREELGEFCERQRQRSKPGPGGVLPEECVVRTFNSSAVANPDRNTVDLTIHYTTFEPTNATIDYGIKGLRLGIATRHLGAQGVLHLDKHLSVSQTEKLHKLLVQIRIPAAPSRCKRYYSNSTRVQHR